MGINTPIEYVDSSVNPIWGCGGCELWTPQNKVCYAGRFITRMGDDFNKPTMKTGVIEKTLQWPILTSTVRAEKPWLNSYPRIIFLNDMSDTWTEKVYRADCGLHPLPVDWLEPYMEAMINSGHIYLLLTKRPRRAVEFFRDLRVPSNFWLGTSITSQATMKRAQELAKLRDVCEGKLWMSVEPLYGQLTFGPELKAFDWVVLGGESGPNALPTLFEEFSYPINQCREVGAKVFVKQLGSAYKGYGSKGQDYEKWPQSMKIREMPLMKI